MRASARGGAPRLVVGRRAGLDLAQSVAVVDALGAGGALPEGGVGDGVGAARVGAGDGLADAWTLALPQVGQHLIVGLGVDDIYGTDQSSKRSPGPRAKSR